jgi:hypothetical protein
MEEGGEKEAPRPQPGTDVGGGDEERDAPELIGGVDPKLLRKALKKRVPYIEKHMECVSCERACCDAVSQAVPMPPGRPLRG